MIEFLQCFGYILLMNFFEHLNIQLIQCTHFIFEKTFFICSQEKYKVDHIKVNNDAIDQTVL